MEQRYTEQLDVIRRLKIGHMHATLQQSKKKKGTRNGEGVKQKRAKSYRHVKKKDFA